MVQVRILKEDYSGRFHAGEVGELLVNDYARKYQFKVLLQDGKADVPDPPFTRQDGTYSRIFYFYEGEIEVLS